MTIDEAIKILSYNGLCPEGCTWGDYLKAVKLGLEALGAIDGIRKHHHLYTASLLPGETKD